MQNKSLENTVYVVSAGAFGVFLRWLQLQLAFDEEGLCGPSVFNVIVPAYLLLAAYLLRRRVWEQLGHRWVLPKKPEEALANPGKLYAVLRWLPGGLMILGGLLLIRGSEVEKQVMLLRVIGGLAILTGGCVPLLLQLANKPLQGRFKDLPTALSLAPLLLFAVWLIYDYQKNAVNPVIWAFLVEVAAVSTLLIAFFRLAGYAFGQVSSKKTLFWLQYGMLMSLVVLADDRSMSMQVIFFAAGLMLGLADFILLSHLVERQTGDEEEEKKPKKKEKKPLNDGGLERL